MRRIFALIILLNTNALACSFAPSLISFEQSSEQNIEPIKPSFKVLNISRGEDDGNHGSCSDAGHIALQLESLPKVEQGYRFEIIEGEFEDNLFLDIPVVPSSYVEDKRNYYFTWFDGSSNEQEPFDITVKVIAVSKSGKESEAQLLRITHPGVNKPWWKFW